MAKRDAVPLEDQYFADVENADDLEEVVRELPSEGLRVILYRTYKQGGRPAYITELTPTTFRLAEIKEEYGGGTYLVRIVGKKGTGTQESAFAIEGEPKKPGAAETKSTIMADPAADYLTRLQTASMEEKINFLLQRELNRNNAPVAAAAPAIDPLAMMTSIMALVQGIVKALPAPAVATLPPTASGEVIGLVKEIMKLIPPGGEGGEGGGDWGMRIMGMAERLLPPVLQSLAARMPIPAGATPEQVRRVPAGAVRVDAPGGGIDPLRGNGAAMDFFAKAKGLIAQIMPLMISDAAKDTDGSRAERWAETIFDQILEEDKPKIIEWLSGTSWPNDLVRINPTVQHQAAWWETMKDNLLDYLTGKVENEAGDLEPEHDN